MYRCVILSYVKGMVRVADGVFVKIYKKIFLYKRPVILFKTHKYIKCKINIF